MPDTPTPATPVTTGDTVVTPETAIATPRSVLNQGDGAGIHVLLVIAGTLMAVMSWLLPWFVTAFSAGVGFSPQDLVISPPQGPTAAGVYVMAGALVITVATLVWDVVRRLRHRTGAQPRLARVRAGAAIAGALGIVVTWLCAAVFVTDAGFGVLPKGVITDAAVWIGLYGYILLAAAWLGRDWILRHPNIAFGCAALPFAVLLPVIFAHSQDLLYWAASQLAVFTLLGLGLNVVVGYAGLLDLGYAAFFAIGAYVCASLASPLHHVHLPFYVIIFIGAAIASTAGAILGAPTLRLRGDYLAIVTLGFGEIVPNLATNNIFGLTGGPNGISSIDAAALPFLPFNSAYNLYFWTLLVLMILAALTLRNLERSRLGRAWVALREDEIAAAATGINTTTTKLLAFSIGASISGFAGAFYGSLVSVVSPDDFQFSVSVAVLSIVVLGGIGNIAGVVVGGMALTFTIFWALPHMQEWMTTFGQTTGVTALGTIQYTDYTYIIYGLTLILMMLLRPAGLLPSRARRVEMAMGTHTEAVADVAASS